MTDVMFVNRNVFMVTPARKLKFLTVEHIPSQKSQQLSKTLDKLIKLYGRGGFIIFVILGYMDSEEVAKTL